MGMIAHLLGLPSDRIAAPSSAVGGSVESKPLG